jgi:putative ABC transport system permease protein
MNALKYIWRNICRNRLRSLLTILSVGFSLSLMTVLYGYMASQETWGEEAEKYNRIVVMNIQGFSGLLPISYVDRVRNMDGVTAAVPYAWYGGSYGEEVYPFSQFATDPDDVFNVWDEFTIPDQQLKAWQGNRRGCVVDRRIAERRGWEIGERIQLKGEIYQFDLDLELVGIFDSPKNTDSLLFHWEYLDEGLKQSNARGTGNAGTIFAKCSAAGQIPQIITAIDDRFASSDDPTRTQTEAAFAQMFADMLGNIQAFIRNIALAVVFSLSLVAGNAMAMSMRERVTEVAVLKAIGFPRAHVLRMILGESCIIAISGGLLGVIMGCGCLTLLHGAMPQWFPFAVHEMLGLWTIWGLLVAIVIGLVSGIVPAVRAANMSVIDGLRRVV